MATAMKPIPAAEVLSRHPATGAERARRATDVGATPSLTVLRKIEASPIPGLLSRSEAVMALAREVHPGRLTPELFFEFEALLMGDGRGE